MSIYKLSNEQKRNILKHLFENQLELHSYLNSQYKFESSMQNISHDRFNYLKKTIELKDSFDFMQLKRTIELSIKFYSYGLEDIEYSKLVEYYGKFSLYDEMMYLLFSDETNNKYREINVMCTLQDIKEAHIRKFYLKQFVECDKVHQEFKDQIIARLVAEELAKEA